MLNRRFVYGYGTRRAREVIHSGGLGRLLLADMRFKAWRPPAYYAASGWRGTWAQEGGAALINQGIHGVDLLTWIAGPIARVSGHARHLRHAIEADAVREGRDPAITGEDALHALAVVQAINESERRGGPVTIDEVLA